MLKNYGGPSSSLTINGGLWGFFGIFVNITMPRILQYIFICAALWLGLPAIAQVSKLQVADPFLRIPVLKPGANPAQTFNNLIFLRATASKSTVFTGEAFLVEYKLYRAISTDPSPGKQPAFNGCSVQELSPINDANIETVNGKTYHVNILRKVQLTPLQEGPIALDSASVNNSVQYITTDKPNEVQTIAFEAVSHPITVEVKPLPDAGRPTGFNGIVGNFSMSIKAESNTIPADEDTHITLTFKGTGNITGIAIPAIEWPANTEHFEPATNQHILHENFPAGGDKTFEIPVVGKKEGTVVIPPVYFTFFNTETQLYDSIHTDSLTLHFTKAQPKGKLHEIITEDITNRKYLWIVPAIALTVAFIFIITGKTQRKEKKRLQQQKQADDEPLPLSLPPAEKTDFKAAAEALAAMEDNHAFFNAAKDLLTQALREKLNSFAFYENDILQELQQKSHNKVLVETVHQLYKICNQNLYSPIMNAGQRSTVQEALAEVIKQLEA
jgi:hypothetical protein